MTDDVDDFFAHHGVKGMHWGRRTSRGGYIGQKSAAKAHKEPTHPDAANAIALKTRVHANKTTNVLSNDELEGLIKRMNLEQNYSRLDPKQISAGKKLADQAGKTLANTARGIAQQESNNAGKIASAVAKKVAKNLAEEALRNAANKKRGPKDGGTYSVVRKALAG